MGSHGGGHRLVLAQKKAMASHEDGCGHKSPKAGLGVPAKSQEKEEEAFMGEVWHLSSALRDRSEFDKC